MNSIWSHRRLRFVIIGAATLVTGAALASAALAGLGALNLGPAAASQYPKKVTVCHRTHSKKHPWVQIRISVHALKAHLRHGDFVVDATHPCPPPGSTPTAKSKQHGKGKGHGKHGKNSAGKHGKNSAGKHGKNTAGTHGKKSAGTHGKKSAGTHGKKSAGTHGNSSAAKNQNHGNNNGGKGHGKK
jgi:hypothetical protein